MPKKPFSIGTFKGLNSEADPRDIEPGALVTADDVFIDKQGKIRLARVAQKYSPGDDVSNDTDINYVPYRGYGLFEFGSDYDMAGTAANTNYLLLQGGAEFVLAENYNDSDFDVDDDFYTADTASTSFSLGTSNTNVKPNYYYVDGALRICDGHFGNTNNSPKWLGYINRTHFDGLTPGGSADTYAGWYIQNQEIVAPTTITGSGYPSAGNINIYITSNNPGSTDGSWEIGRYLFGASFIYDGSQESKITFFDAGGGGLGWDISNVGEYFSLMFKATSPLNPRLTGVNIYCKNFDTDGEWIFMAYVDLEDGLGLPNTEVSIDFVEESADSVFIKSASAIDVLSPSSITYEMNSGISIDEDNIFAKYKTACIANRRAYIGNVSIDGVVYGDKMLKSPVGKFDVFPESNNIDVVINDGDEIIKLVALSDRILQFKKKTLYIINVAEDYEILENTFKNMGIDEPFQVCEIDNGIAWCNSLGVYIYSDGKMQEISLPIKDDFQAFFVADSNSSLPSIGYDSVQKKLIIINSVGYKSVTTIQETGNAYVFDLTNGSWTKSLSMFPALGANENYSNFINNVDGEILVSLYNSNDTDIDVYHLLTSDKSTSSLNILTGDIPIEDISVKKRLYAVRITYKADGTAETAANVKIRYGIDGGTSVSSTFYNDSTLKCTAGAWSTVERAISTPVNFYSIAIRILGIGAVASGFEVNDISIIYRPIGVR
jgi:hypothetical protein